MLAQCGAYQSLNMPEALKKSEIQRQDDPSVAKQYENADFETKFKDFYEIADKRKIAMMGTYRPGVGVRTIAPAGDVLIANSGVAGRTVNGCRQAERTRLSLPCQCSQQQV